MIIRKRLEGTLFHKCAGCDRKRPLAEFTLRIDNSKRFNPIQRCALCWKIFAEENGGMIPVEMQLNEDNEWVTK